MTSLATLPGFLTHFIAGIALVWLGGWVYCRITPQDELQLVRDGNSAAAIALAGALVGLAIPVGASVSNSANLLDAAVWGVVALAAQLGCFVVVTRLLGPGWREAMEQRGEAAGAIVKAGVSIAVGIVNAAAMSS
jgi:putative membrane protein